MPNKYVTLVSLDLDQVEQLGASTPYMWDWTQLVGPEVLRTFTESVGDKPIIIVFDPGTGGAKFFRPENLPSEHTEARVEVLAAALKPFADFFDGDLSSVGGGTFIAPTFKVQNFKDAKEALKGLKL